MDNTPEHDASEPVEPVGTDAEADAAQAADAAPDGAPDAAAQPQPASADRVRSRWTRIAIAAGIVAVLILIVLGIDAVATSPDVCASCHEMKPWVASWSVSAHADVACYSCHQTPRQWYGSPIALAERWTKLAGQMVAHSQRSSDDTSVVSAVGAPPIPDSACLQCHDPARVGTSRFGVQIRHEEHARRNGSCVSCHVLTAHPDPKGDRDTLFMKQCFTCHDIKPGSKAPGECTVCHLKGVDLHPDSHKKGDWKAEHGKVAIADRKQCAMCHAESFCKNCHVLVMPHPAGWAKGPNTHAVVARLGGTKVCEKCHVGANNLCGMCHHRGFQPGKGPWVRQHSDLASQTGPAFCFGCHQAAFCAKCHKPGQPPVGG